MREQRWREGIWQLAASPSHSPGEFDCGSVVEHGQELVYFSLMPVDVDKQVAYWKAGASEDLGVAELLLEQRRTRYALFFGHLALEKALKALVTRATCDIPPRTHDLVRLAALARLSLSSAQDEVLQDMQQYNLEGRYPSDWPAAPAADSASLDFTRAKELTLWLLQQ